MFVQAVKPPEQTQNSLKLIKSLKFVCPEMIRLGDIPMLVSSISEEIGEARVAEASAFYRHDAVIGLLTGKLRLTDMTIVSFVAAFGVFVQVFMLPILGIPMQLDVIVASLIQTILILPFGTYLYLRFPSWLAGLFRSLEKNAVIGAPRHVGSAAYEQWFIRMARAVDSPIWGILGGLAVIFYWAYRLFGNVPTDFTNNVYLAENFRVPYRILLLLLYSLPLYGGVVTIGRLMVGMKYTGQFFDGFVLHINPLNMDRCGGLGYVGRMLTGGVLVATILGAAAASLIIMVSATSPSSEQGLLSINSPIWSRAETMMLGFVYLTLTPLLLRYWLWAPHLAMIRAREQAQHPLADAFSRVFASAANGNEARGVKAKTEQLSDIKQQFEFIEDTFPVWPLPSTTMKRLLATASLPTISSLLAALFPHFPAVIFELLKAWN